jgi:hypothetical protein
MLVVCIKLIDSHAFFAFAQANEALRESPRARTRSGAARRKATTAVTDQSPDGPEIVAPPPLIAVAALRARAGARTAVSAS